MAEDGVLCARVVERGANWTSARMGTEHGVDVGALTLTELSDPFCNFDHAELDNCQLVVNDTSTNKLIKDSIGYW